MRRASSALVALTLLVAFVSVSVFRYVDVDEGYYLGATALVLDGGVPYLDFFYQQMPLLPYAYGAFAHVTDESWYAMRLASALLAAGVGVLMFEHVRRRKGWASATVAVTLYGASGLVLVWFPLVKTYALSTMFLFAAYVLVDGGANGNSRRRIFVAGALAALSVEVRLLLAAALPALAWHVAVSRRDRWARSAAFGGGMAVGLAPALVFLALDADRFIFNNLGAHAHRSAGGLVGDLGQKARLAENLLGLGTPADAAPQFVLLVVAAAAAGAAALAARSIPLSLAIGVLLTLVSFLPTPSYPQYFCVTVPFFAVAAAELVSGKQRLVAPVVGALAVYGVIGILDAARTVRLYPDQRVATVERVLNAIDRRTRPGEQVIVSWPGYLFGTHARPQPGFENDFAPNFASELSPERAKRYHLLTAAGVEARVAEGRSRLVVIKRWHALGSLPDWEAAAERGRYRRTLMIAPRGRAEIGAPVSIYERTASR